MDSSAARILDGLDPQQREAVEAVRGPVCILAGAGTGKTRTITHRIAYAVHSGVVAPSQLLAVTFTQRAAGEMRGRLRALGVGNVQARTFHSAAMRQLRYFAPRVLGGPMPELAEYKIRLVSQAAMRHRLQLDQSLRRDLASEIEWAKSSLVPPDRYAELAVKADRQPPLDPERVAKVYATYEEVKRAAEVIDFEDLLLVTAVAIEEHRDVAEEIRSQYRHFVVDEYQDVNPLQQRLLDAWLGGRDDLCVVGDANQTIYSFTGATPDHLLGFARRYPGAVVVRLERDYRSTPQVVGLANQLISFARGQVAAGAKLRLVGQRPEGPAPSFAEHDDEPAEAASVAQACARLIADGTPAAEIAVLYRVNAQSEQYESALSAVGVPYVLKGGERFFERPEIREAGVLLRAAARSADSDAPLVRAVADVLSSMNWSPDHPPSGGGQAREKWDSLNALLQLAEELVDAARAAEPQAAPPGLPEFVTELEGRAAAQHAPTVQGVTLASLHAAKGLEWDAVFLVGLVDGTMPIQHAQTDEAIEEERRLLYVGITRARERLQLSWALSRSAGGRKGRRRSRFIWPLMPDEPRPTPSSKSTKSGKASVCAQCGQPLKKGAEKALGRCSDCPGDVDLALFEKLRSWRSDRASAQSVPAYVVFTDATLAAIAESKPADVPDLVRLPGIGQRKLDLYGADVLALVAGRPLPEEETS